MKCESKLNLKERDDRMLLQKQSYWTSIVLILIENDVSEIEICLQL
jgi:hypothetical protein